jgi:hypothetical protein
MIGNNYNPKTEIDAIKLKTDNLPSDPADASVIDVDLTSIESKIDIMDTNVDDIETVIGAKSDVTGIPGVGSLYTLAGYMAYYHVHAPSIVYPRNAAPVTLTAGIGAYTEGVKVEIVAAGVTDKYADIHFIVLGNISANDDYVLKLYTGAVGQEVFWGETSFTRDTNQFKGSTTPIQGIPIPSGTRISASLMSGSGGNTVQIKIHTHGYGA